MLQPIYDTELEDDPGWLDHNPLDGSAIGGAMPTEYELVTDVPGQPHAILLASKGPAWETMEAYNVRPNFIAVGWPYQVETFTIEVGPKSSPHIFEFDLITIFALPNGAVWKGDGSVQIDPDLGWVIMVDSAPPAPAVPSWLSTGVKIAPLTFGEPHIVQVEHFTDIAATPPTHSVLCVWVDGTAYPIPAAFQKLPCRVSTWAKNKSLLQMQSTAGAKGGMVDETFTAISLQHREAL